MAESKAKLIGETLENLRGRRILVSPGHVGYKGVGSTTLGIGYRNPDTSRTGTLVSRDYNEEQLNSYFAAQILLILEHAGAEADLCVGPFAHKACRGADFKPDAFIEIHCNSVRNRQPNGLEIWHDHEDLESILLAVHLLGNLIRHTGFASRGLKDMDSQGNELDERDAHDALFEVMPPQIRTFPLVLIELGFLSNDGDAAYLTDLGNRETIAAAICRGLDDFFASKSDDGGAGGSNPSGEDNV